MSALTTRQRDLLSALIDADAPIKADNLATELNLTIRQVTYALKGIKQWLKQHEIDLDIKPGVGISLQFAPGQLEMLQTELYSSKFLQLILSAEERQQLLALFLLVIDQPKYLSELEHLLEVSRTTVIKDLDAIEAWFSTHGITLKRRPNYGVELDAGENTRQNLISMLIWGETPFGNPLIKINYTQGLIFVFEKDADLHPLLQITAEIIYKWDLVRIFGLIANVEAQLGGRFTDDAFLHLALVIAIQTERVSQGHFLTVDEDTLQELKALSVWKYAKMIANRSGLDLTPSQRNTFMAGIAMALLAAPRDRNLPVDIDASFNDLISEIMAAIATFYNTPEMSEDLTLRDGLTNHIIPACLRQKFNIWQPATYPHLSLSDKYAREFELANELAALIEQRISILIPDDEINNIAALLRASRIRLRPHLFRQVLVVCPSGMASAQLLMSRLEARFPRLGPLKGISLRELTPDLVATADLIISTVPLKDIVRQEITVIHVHPLLLAEDIEAITQFIT
ncbi:MAG: BglG family transcription antiterminator [Brevefilum sp.]